MKIICNIYKLFRWYIKYPSCQWQEWGTYIFTILILLQIQLLQLNTIKAIDSNHCLLHHSWTFHATSVPLQQYQNDQGKRFRTLHKSLLAKNVPCFLQCWFPPGFHSIISPVPCTLLYNFIYLFPPPFQHLQPFGLIAGSFLLPEICQVLHEQMPSCIKQNNDMNDQTTQQRSLVSMLVGSTIMIIIKKHYSACIYSATNSE